MRSSHPSLFRVGFIMTNQFLQNTEMRIVKTKKIWWTNCSPPPLAKKGKKEHQLYIITTIYKFSILVNIMIKYLLNVVQARVQTGWTLCNMAATQWRLVQETYFKRYFQLQYRNICTIHLYFDIVFSVLSGFHFSLMLNTLQMYFTILSPIWCH